jgi:hypothetical protein
MPEDQTVRLLYKYKQQTLGASRAEMEGTVLVQAIGTSKEINHCYRTDDDLFAVS